MLFGPEKVIACPHCLSLAKVFTLRSGNTSGAVRWTDGKMRAPMLPAPPEITRCQACSRFYWVADAIDKGRLEVPAPENAPPGWVEAPHITELDETELLEALASGLGSKPARLLRLRTLAWWAANDAFRAPPGAAMVMPGRLSAAAKNNLEALYGLLAPTDWESRLMKAEAARQLGLFEECLAILAPDFPNRFDGSARRIAALAREGNPQLQILDGQ